MKKLLAIAILFGLAAFPVAALARQPTAAQIAIEQVTVIEYMVSGTPAYDVQIMWGPCLQENAWYWRGGGPIHLCLELNDGPASIFAAAHEAGHALVDMMELPIDDNPMAGEQAADELAALFLIEMGRFDDVVGGAIWFMQDWDTESSDGVHPSSAQRVYTLLCLADGAEQVLFEMAGDPKCAELYMDTWLRWAMAFADFYASAGST